MGQLNVNPADLLKAAGDYADLSARVAQLSPQAAAQIQAVAASHGPMGYPIAVGIAMGLADREPAVQAKMAQFSTYSDRFTGHAGTYVDQDRAAAAKLDAIAFPEMHVDPKPKPETPTKWVVCWLPSPDADPAKYCPADTTRIEYVDSKGQWIQKDVETGAETNLNDIARPGVQYLPAPPTGPAPPGVTDRLWPDKNGNLVQQTEGQDGEPPRVRVFPPGKISW